MGDNYDYMEVCDSEDTETEYFQEVTGFDNSLEQSIDSLQGSITLPTFNMDYSNSLQGSQGFQVVGARNYQSMNSSSSSDRLVLCNETGYATCTSLPDYSEMSPSPTFQNETNTNIKTESLYNFPRSESGTVDQSQLTLLSQISDTVNAFGGLGMNNKCPSDRDSELTTGRSSSQDSGEPGGTSSDEKSSKVKTSPRRRGRKSRSSSSTALENQVKCEGSGVSPSRADMCSDNIGQSELGVRPSLMDEILTEKKMALLRSPEVIQFLQHHQNRLVREKRISSGHSSDS